VPVKRDPWRILVGVLGGIAIIVFLGSLLLLNQYAYTRPELPDAAVGRIYPLNTHGSIVYLNSQERLLAFGLMGLAGLFFSSAVILDVIRRHQDDGAS